MNPQEPAYSLLETSSPLSHSPKHLDFLLSSLSPLYTYIALSLPLRGAGFGARPRSPRLERGFWGRVRFRVEVDGQSQGTIEGVGNKQIKHYVSARSQHELNALLKATTQGHSHAYAQRSLLWKAQQTWQHPQANHISQDEPLLHAHYWQHPQAINNTVMHPVVRLPFEGLTSSW